MRGKVAKQLRRLARLQSPDPNLVDPLYQVLKKGWQELGRKGEIQRAGQQAATGK